MAVQSVQVPPELAKIISAAGDKSGVDFDYLLQTAMRESSLDPSARAQTSSAVGLYQFLESTWLEVLKLDGPGLGYGQVAQNIVQKSDGDFAIPDNGLRQEILALREDPQMSADLAAAFTKRNGAYLQDRFGRMPSPGELYIAHFLGARGAERLFEAGLQNANQIAADIFPKQAKANPAIFYEGGAAKTVRQVYESLVAKHGASGETGGATSPTARPASRYGPAVVAEGQNVDFQSLYSTSPAPQGAAQPLIDNGVRNVVVDPGGALFVQLYGR